MQSDFLKFYKKGNNVKLKALKADVVKVTRKVQVSFLKRTPVIPTINWNNRLCSGKGIVCTERFIPNTYKHNHIYIYIYIHINVHIKYVHTCIYIYIYIHTHTYIRRLQCVCVYIHALIYIRAYISYIHTYIHTHTHTHTRVLCRKCIFLTLIQVIHIFTTQL